jgi:antitoxin component HigA of HigAB toxin-antitoxin module
MSTATMARSDDARKQLEREFMLRPIRTKEDHEAAGKILNRLMGRERPLSQSEQDYMEMLMMASHAYETSAHRMRLTKLRPVDAVQFLMKEHSMNAEALGEVLGNQPAASLFLTGKRALSKAQIIRLSQRFKVEPGVFLE